MHWMPYFDLLEQLSAVKEEKFASFQRKLIPTRQTVLGVRTPVMRKIAKQYVHCVETLLSFPDEYYEVTFIKLSALSLASYKTFIRHVEQCVSLIDNWATCDCFKAKCIHKHKDDFLPILDKIWKRGGEFDKRYVFVTLLYCYIDEKYLPIIENYIRNTDCAEYYVHMAIAWLTAEILVKRYDDGVALLQKGILDKKTHNKAIQKAVESYRLTQEQKTFLRRLKIKNT